jgi:tetratricopeptide (TPR) repeat protein
LKRKEPQELISDKRRQAVASLRGYVYQIWETVYKWINLKEDEVIFLEGAEDFDILGPKKAETIQVKHTTGSKSLTLRSKEVIEAISNFWEHQKKNPKNKIELHLLTTMNRGCEKHTPFGKMSGLDYWDSCKRPGTDITILRDFLINEIILSGELKNFIRESEDSELRERLIQRIHWNTGNNPKEFIEDLVERRITYHGDKLGISPSIAKKVVPNLLKHVFDVICRDSNRRLEYYDFLVLFEEATTTRVPLQQLEFQTQVANLTQLIKPLGNFLNTAGFLELTRKVRAESEFIFSSPPLPHKIVKREKLVSKLSECLSTKGILVLKGTTGVGKSILARLVVGENEKNWKWMNMRGLLPDQIKELFLREAITLGEQSKDEKFVLDDLKFDPQSIQYEYALEGLLYALSCFNGKVIITTQEDIPSRIKLNLQIPLESLVNVPWLTIEEIKELASAYGCPKGKKLDSWSKVMLAKTQGHPQLIHAYVRSLEVKKWPNVSIDDFVKEEDIESVRREARKSLIQQLPSEESRSFVYKLSMIKHPFRRDHAIELGNKIHNLSNPGEVLDLLIGPWVEPLNANYLRVSPLLDHAAEAIYSSAQLKEFNKEIAETFLICKKLTLLEAHVILLHGFLASSGRPIRVMLSSLLTASEEHWKKIAHEFWWLTAIGIEKGKKIFPSDPFVNNYLRLFQFRIAVETDSVNLAPKIANLWESELDYGQEPKIKILDNIIFLIKTLICYEVPFSQRVVISRIAKLIAFIKEFENTFKQPFKLDDSRSNRSLASSLFLFAIIRCRSANDLDELLTSLGSLHEEIRNEILSLLMTEMDPSEALINNVFLDELNSKSPQWDRFIITLERTIEYAFSWNVESLARAAYRTIAVIQDEQKNKSNDALKTIKKAIKQLGYEHPFLGNERAIILYNQKDYKEALKIWEDILPDWPENSIFSPIFHLPFSMDCAAKLGMWSKVKEIAFLGEQLAKQYGKSITAVGFRAEYAFALWKTRNFQESINSFAEVLDQIPILPDPYKDIHSYKLQKLIGHALAWMTQEVSNQVQLAEPRSGCFSRQEADEKIKDFPLQPVALMWYFLADLEYKVGSGNAMFERLKTESVNLDLSFIYYMIEHIRIGHLLKEFKFKSLVSELKNWCKHYELNRKHIATDHEVFEKVDLSIKITDTELCSSFQHWLPRLLLVAIIKLVNRGEYATALVNDWKADSVRSGYLNNKLEKWFGFIENAPNMNTQELVSIMRNGDPEMRCLAALNISAKELIKPSIRYYADLMMVEVMKISPWIEAVDSDIEQIISRNWLRVTSKQSFALISPVVNSPLIIDACKDQSKGLKKAAKILLAAKNAVQISIPDQAMKDLKELSKASGIQRP